MRLLTALLALCLFEATLSAPTDTAQQSHQVAQVTEQQDHLFHLEEHAGRKQGEGEEVVQQEDDTKADPEFTAGFFEGDMDIELSRNADVMKSSRWPRNEIHFKISESFDSKHRDYILMAMEEITKVSCLRFIPASESTTKYLSILSEPSGCFSSVGYRDRVQILNLKMNPLREGCFRIGSIQHELLHTLGFYHQQSTANRDDYVKILKENILEDKIHNFQKYEKNKVTDYGVEYDYDSIMHYSAYAFSKNGKKTIIPLKGKNMKMGQRFGLSEGDIEKLNTMYNCYGR